MTAGGEKVDAFVPFDLPPARPALLVDGKLERRLRDAEQALLRLDLAGEMVPSLDWFIYAFVRKEAVVTSQIEGTQASLVDLLAFEAADHPEPNANIEEVTNYLDALAYARSQLASKRGLPLSMRLLNEAHRGNRIPRRLHCMHACQHCWQIHSPHHSQSPTVWRCAQWLAMKPCRYPLDSAKSQNRQTRNWPCPGLGEAGCLPTR